MIIFIIGIPEIKKIVKNNIFVIQKLFQNDSSKLLEPISIELKQRDVNELMEQNQFFIDNNYGVLDKNLNQSVDVNLYKNNKKIEGRLKLNGQTNSHREKFSFSIKSKSKLFDNSSNLDFSFRTYDERYIYDHLSALIFKRNEMLATQIEYKNLFVNGRDYGVYAIQDNINSAFLEDNNYRNGPVLALRNYHFESLYYSNSVQDLENYKKGFIEDVNEDTKNSAISNFAIKQLNYFFEKKVNPSDIFDYDYWAKYFAICEIYLCYDLDTQDIRFYFNPITKKFIPIVDDPHSNLSKENFSYLDSHKAKRGGYVKFFEDHYYFILDAFFKNNYFLKKYIVELEQLIEQRKIPESKYIKKISFFEQYKNFNSNFYIERFNYISNKLNNEKILYSKLDLLSNNTAVLYLDLIENTPISLTKLTYKNDVIYDFDNLDIYPNFNDPKITHKLEIKDFSVLIEESSFNDLTLHFKKIGLKRDFQIPLDEVSSDYKFEKENLITKDIFKNFNRDGNKLICPKTIELNGNYFVNKQYILDCSNTREIILTGDTVLNIFNKFEIGSLNSETNLITNNYKFSFNVINAKELSKIINFNIVGKANFFNYASNFKTGIFTFYNSDITIKNFNSSHSESEDLINCIRSEIDLENINIKNTSSDAIDFDFCKVSINGIYIKNAKGDALDFSYSSGKISNILIEGSFDKALSIGENSILNLNNIKLNQNKIGIAVKDGSDVSGEFFYFNLNKYDLLSYNKKKGYNLTSTYIKHVYKNKKVSAYNEIGHVVELDNEYYENQDIDFELFKE